MFREFFNPTKETFLLASYLCGFSAISLAFAAVTHDAPGWFGWVLVNAYCAYLFSEARDNGQDEEHPALHCDPSRTDRLDAIAGTREAIASWSNAGPLDRGLALAIIGAMLDDYYWNEIITRIDRSTLRAEAVRELVHSGEAVPPFGHRFFGGSPADWR